MKTYPIAIETTNAEQVEEFESIKSKAFYTKFSWTAQEINKKFYWFNEQGKPSEPFNTEQSALDALDDYENDFQNP